MFYKFVNNLWLLSLFVFFCYPSLKANVIDKTEEVFSASTGYKGVIAAYADVNNDKATDVFIISGDLFININKLLMLSVTVTCFWIKCFLSSI